MTKGWRGRGTAAVAALGLMAGAVGCGDGAAASSRVADAPAGGPHWRVAARYPVPSTGTAPAGLTGIAAGGGRVWAAGTAGDAGPLDDASDAAGNLTTPPGDSSGLLLTLDGGALRRVPTPLTEHESGLGAVAVSGGRVWAAGFDGAKRRKVTLTGDGASFTVSRKARAASRYGKGTFTAVAPGAKGTAWLTGWLHGPDRSVYPRLSEPLWFDGTAWHQAVQGIDENARVHLAAIAPAAGGAAWAVGDLSRRPDVNRPFTEPVIARWDGRSWTIQDDLPGTTGGHLAAMAGGSRGGLWAVGGTGDPGRAATPLAVRYDGRDWYQVPAYGLHAPFVAVAGDGADGAWAADSTGALWHTDGRTWAPGTVDGVGAGTALTIVGLARDDRTGRLYAAANTAAKDGKVQALVLTR
ncbi:hypothetical protein [Actinomadura parmotrematis]|uniref:Exo-alpha-sialidase n=1 Tax=Actinomadura parmotrematis TaxID=2864039 RepID=A0ABS7FQ66_9ACTN|nr:hypothetical protein [Actinomadura parmotrematis]MBW8482456.1 hypothetical protein [Actinomadura parmotrematis]